MRSGRSRLERLKDFFIGYVMLAVILVGSVVAARFLFALLGF